LVWPAVLERNVKAFVGDPDLPLLLSLEQYDAETGRAAKCAIFHQRTIERVKPVEYVESASEALLVSLNESGRIDWARMEALTGRERSELEEELRGLVFLNPEGRIYETANAYLSGNVRAKLAAAEAAARLDGQFRPNVEALREVQPKDLEPAEIEAGLGAPGVPASDIQDFLTELLDGPSDSVTVSHAEAIVTWKVTADYRAKNQVSNHTTHGTSRFYATELLEQALNGKAQLPMTRKRTEPESSINRKH
jgi:N12 class adenine-specific DNA methylase